MLPPGPFTLRPSPHSNGRGPLWPYYCDTDGQSSLVALVMSFLSSLITGWIPSLLNSLWFGMLVPLVTFACVQVAAQLCM